jgi:hypothetical protein
MVQSTSLVAISHALRSTARADFLVISFPGADAIQIPAPTVRRALAALKGPRFAGLVVTAQPHAAGEPGALCFRWATGRLMLTHQDHVMVKTRYHSKAVYKPVLRGAYLRLGVQPAAAQPAA